MLLAGPPGRQLRGPNGALTPSLDVYAGHAEPGAGRAPAITRLTDVTSNPNWDQFAGRTVPFAGDYLWIDSAARPHVRDLDRLPQHRAGQRPARPR